MNSVPQIYEPHDDGGKDYIVQVKIKNGPLLRAIRMRGYKTTAAFSRACGFGHPVTVYKYLALQAPALRTVRGGHGKEFCKSVLTMAAILRLPPEALFPEQHLEYALKRNSGELELSYEDIQQLIEGDTVPLETLMERERLYEKLDKSLTLIGRQGEVLRRRFGIGREPQTAQKVADEFGVTVARIQQMEQKALRKLRKAPLANPLADCGGFGFLDNQPERTT